MCNMFSGEGDMAHIIIFSRGFAAHNIWAIHEHLSLDFQGKGRVWALGKPAFLEKYDSLLVDAKAAHPVDHHWLNLINCWAALDSQGLVNKGHDAYLLKSQGMGCLEVS